MSPPGDSDARLRLRTTSPLEVSNSFNSVLLEVLGPCVGGTPSPGAGGRSLRSERHVVEEQDTASRGGSSYSFWSKCLSMT